MLAPRSKSIRIDAYNNTLVNVGSSTDGGPLTLTAAGKYYVLVDGESSSSVGYQFRLTDTSTKPLSFGTTVSGTVTNASQSDVYSFTGTANEHVYFQELTQLGNVYYSSYWYLYGPNNAPIASNYFGSDLSATLPTNGNYTLKSSRTWVPTARVPTASRLSRTSTRPLP